VALEGLENPGLILPHEAAELHGAGAQNGGELPFVFFSGQRDSPSAVSNPCVSKRLDGKGRKERHTCCG
jgi:hypothetical protein